jgi:hypothetical protein
MKVVTFWSTLMRYAYELGQARLSGDKDRIHAAKAKHDAYRDLCLEADEMVLGVSKGEL